jgi:hypothetical protein
MIKRAFLPAGAEKAPPTPVKYTSHLTGVGGDESARFKNNKITFQGCPSHSAGSITFYFLGVLCVFAVRNEKRSPKVHSAALKTGVLARFAEVVEYDVPGNQ